MIFAIMFSLTYIAQIFSCSKQLTIVEEEHIILDIIGADVGSGYYHILQLYFFNLGNLCWSQLSGRNIQYLLD